MNYGLLAFGAALGDPMPIDEAIKNYTEDAARVRGYGYEGLQRADPKIGLTDLAVSAGQAAMVAAGIAAASIDLVVLAITDVAEYLYWDAAAHVASRLDATSAEAVLLTQACTSGVVSLDTVAGRFATHPDYDTALIIAVNRTCEQYWNRLDTQPMVYSDGAAATVARRDHSRLRWLTTEVITDGRYADLYRLDVGGAAAPFTPDADAEPATARDAWDVMEHFDYDIEAFEEFTELLDRNAVRVVERACARVSVGIADISRFLLLADNRLAVTALAAALEVPVARTNLELGLRHGHLGAADQIYALGHYADAGELADGDLIALVSRGRGMSWACTLVRV